jgi:hypothetical protein
MDEVTYEDWGAQYGTVHTYCIESQNECGSSNITCTSGSLRTAPDSPENVSATDGDYSNQIQISWMSAEDTEQYKIYRDGSWMGFVTPNVLEYTDNIPELGISYEYCIEAINICGESEWNCDIGYTAEPEGDVNADGSIDVLDVIVVINIILGLYEPSDYELVTSDINSDGIVDVLDVVMIVNIILAD